MVRLDQDGTDTLVTAAPDAQEPFDLKPDRVRKQRLLRTDINNMVVNPLDQALAAAEVTDQILGNERLLKPNPHLLLAL